MPKINFSAGEITAKLVYYGPGLCGKTTNLEHIHEAADPADRGRFVSLATQGDRTLFFDLLPLGAGSINDFELRFHLYTVPGQVYYNSTRRTVLQGVDGIVFVADSQPSRLEANIEAMYNLYDNLADVGIDPSEVPLVIQYNKRDLPGCVDPVTLQQALNPDSVPAWLAIATEGVGVMETLRSAMEATEARLRGRLEG